MKKNFIDSQLTPEQYFSLKYSIYRGALLEVPHFASIYKSKKHFGLSFAYDAPMIWNDLPDDVRSAKSLSSFRKKLKTYLFEKAYPPFISSFSMVPTPAMSLI